MDSFKKCISYSAYALNKVNYPLLLSSVFLFSHLGLVSTAYASPEGGQVVGGSGSINQSSVNTTINQATQNMAIDWQSYNVQQNERVQYIQPNASSISLNRIVGNNASQIHGKIDANGQVILVNPNGIFFSATSSINVGGIMASGLDIKPSDFMNGNYIFNEVSGTSGSVFNSGIINAATGGNVTLLGKQVKNDGLIVAKLGAVNLAAGKQAVVTFDNAGLLGVRITKEVLQNELGIAPAVLNNGNINAEGGRILLTASVSQDIFSRAVNTGGMTDAKSAVVNADGSFTLGAGADVVNNGTLDVSVNDSSGSSNAGEIAVVGNNVTNSGDIKADNNTGGTGGNIELHATDATLLTENSVTSARSNKSGKGGEVKVLGNKVGLFDQAQVDVSGVNGGGEVLIGGDKTGQNKQIRNADFIYLGENTNVKANALDNGNGGKLITFASDTARIYGNLSARGGANGGNGGFIETSGLRGFEITNAPDISSSMGRGGEWLIDPYNINIIDDGGNSSRSNTSRTTRPLTFTSTGGTGQTTATISAKLITDALANNGTGASVIITTGGTGAGLATDLGDINLTTDIDYQGNNDATLSLNALNNINTNAFDIRADSSNSKLNLVLNANSDNSGGGDVIINNSRINTNGGDFTATGVNFSLTTNNGREIRTDSGNVSITTTGHALVGTEVADHPASISIDADIVTNGGAVTLVSNKGLATTGGTISTTGNINTSDSANGNVSISADGAIIIGGQINTDNGSVSFNDDINIIAGNRVAINNSIATRGGTVLIDKSTSLTTSVLGAINTSNGSATFNSTGAITSGGQVNAGNGTVSFINNALGSTADVNINNSVSTSGTMDVNTNGAIISTNGQLLVGSTATFNSLGAGAITLNNTANDFNGSVVINNTAGNVVVNDIDNIQIGTSSIGTGTLTVNAGLGGGTGGISQAGNITQTTGAGNVGFNAGDGTISLNQSGNNFIGNIALVTGGANRNASIRNQNNIVLTDSVVTGDLTAHTTVGAISQTAGLGLDIGGTTTLTQDGGQSITLGNTNNKLTGLSLLTNSSTGNLLDATIQNSTAIDLQQMRLDGKLSVTATGVITNSTGDIIVLGDTILNAGAANNINLTTGSHDFTNVVVTAANDVTISDVNSINIGDAVNTTSSISGDLDLTAQNGDITQTAILNMTTGSTSTFNALGGTGSGNIILNENKTTRNLIENNFDNIVLNSTGSSFVADANAINIGGTASSIGGDLTINTKGAISQTAGLTMNAGSAANLTSGNGNINLGTQANDLDIVNITTSGAVTLSDSALNGIRLGSVNITGAGTLNVLANGSITDVASEIAVAGTTTLNSGSAAISLNAVAHDFSQLNVNNADSVTVNDKNTLTLGTINVTGSTGTTLDVTTAGILNQTSNASAITNAGNTVINAGANAITLGNGNNDFIGTVSLNNSAGNVVIADANAIQFTSSALGAGTLTVNAGQISGGGISQAGGGITQASAAGAVTLNAGDGVIDLGVSPNEFTGDVTLSTTGTNRNATISDINNIQLAAANVTGNLNVKAGSNSDITQLGTGSGLTVVGISTFDVDIGRSITLGNTNNNLTGLSFLANGSLVGQLKSVTIANSTGLDLQSLNLSDDLNVTAIGDITNSFGSMQVGGDTVLTANLSGVPGETNNITLTGTANEFKNVVIKNGGSVTLTEADTANNGLNIGDVNNAISSISGNLTVSTNGNFTQTAALNMNAGSLATFTSGGSIDLRSHRDNNSIINNDFSNIVLNASGNVDVSDVNGINIGDAIGEPAAASSIGGNLTINANTITGNSGDITQTADLNMSPGTTANFSAGNGRILLDSANNNFNILELSSNNVARVNDIDGLILGNTSVNELTINAAADITENGSSTINVTGLTTLNTSATADINIATGNHTFSDVVFTGNNIAISANSGINIGDSVSAVSPTSTANGGLTLTSGGNITDIGSALVNVTNVGATANLTSRSGNITLNNTDFQGSLTAIAADNITITDSTGLTLNAVTAANTISLNAGTNITGGTLTASRVVLRADSGINTTTQTLAIDAVNSSSNSSLSNEIKISNTGSVILENLKTVGNITFNNDANINMQPGSVDADYNTGVITMTSATGSFLGLGAPDESNPDITGRKGTFVGRFGSFGSAVRPLVIKIKDEILINTRQSISPRYVPRAPLIVNDLSDIKFDFFDASNAVAGEQLITLEELEDIDPAIFSDVRNYTYGQIAIRLPRDQLFEDDLIDTDKK